MSNKINMLRWVVKIKNSIHQATSFYQLYSINVLIGLFNRQYKNNIYSDGLCKLLLSRREELRGNK